jgi:hypothetical protein
MSHLSLKDDLFLLPSLGVGYNPEKLPLIDGTSVKVKRFTASMLWELSEIDPEDVYSVYKAMVEVVVTDPKPIAADELLIDDINSILYGAHIKSYGADYGFRFVCSECETFNDQDYSLLSALTRDSSEIPDFKQTGIEIDIEGQKVSLHLPKLKDERSTNILLRDLSNIGVHKKRKFNRYFVRLATLIDKIGTNDKLSLKAKFEFLSDLLPDEPDRIGTLLSQYSVGLMPTQKMVCSSCGADNDAVLVINQEFFRSKKKPS